MQNRKLKNEFDEDLVLWCKAIVSYCKKTCTKSTSIQSLLKDVDNCKYIIFVTYIYKLVYL